MKATVEIPDDLYRELKVRCAAEGRTVRDVTIDLYGQWLNGKPAEKIKPSAPWLKISRQYVNRDQDHSLEAIRASVAEGRRAVAGPGSRYRAHKK